MYLESSKEKKENKVVSMAVEELSSVFRRICNVESPVAQEKIFMELIQKLASFKSVAEMVKAVVEAKKQLKLKEIEKEVNAAEEYKTDADERGMYVSEMLEVIEVDEGASMGGKDTDSGGSAVFATI